MRHAIARLSLAVAVLTSALVPSAAAAQGASTEITGLAAEHYERGRQLYRDGKFEEAAGELRRAYDRAPHPLLLYNIALAEWRSGHPTRALETARRADTLGIGEGLKDRNRALIRGLETLTSATEMTERVAAARVAAEPVVDAPAPVDEARVGWLGPGLIGLGAVSLGGAVWMNGRLARKVEPYEEAAARSDGEAYDRLNADLKRDQRFGLGFLALGIVSLATGATITIVRLTTAHDSDSGSASTLGVRPSPGGASLEWIMVFP